MNEKENRFSRDNFTAIETVKQGLRDITKLPLETCDNFDAMRMMAKARYIQLVTPAPDSVKLAFAKAL